jgi:RNA polymerase sigma-70 factor (ECF subfamily)
MSKASELSDEILILRSARGDQEAFVQLVHRYEQPLAALIRYRIGSGHDAEDVLQETLLQAWLGVRRLRDPAKVRYWLLQVARNRCRDFLRSPQRRDQPTDPQYLVEWLNRNGRAVAAARQAVAEVRDVLEQVPHREREAAKLFYLEGLTIAEIAKRSRSPEGTVKRRLFDARHHMRHPLGLLSGQTDGEKQNE